MSATGEEESAGAVLGTLEAGSEPRRLIPALGGIYDSLGGFAYPLIRATTGALLIPHFFAKLNAPAGIAGLAQAMLARRGIEPALPLMWLTLAVESVGAVCLVLGLFTRVWAAAVVVEMAVLGLAFHNGGFVFDRPGGGYEYPLFWGLIAFAIVLRGGGPYSLDRFLGYEF